MKLQDRQWVSFECDECPNETEEYDDFDELVAEAKKAGWKIAPADDGYTHTCPTCASSSRLERQRKLFD